MLRRLGCEADSVDDGDEVIAAVTAAAAAGAPYDIVLMDMVMVRVRDGCACVFFTKLPVLRWDAWRRGAACCYRV